MALLVSVLVVGLLLVFLGLVYRYGTRRLIFPAFQRAEKTPADYGLPYEDVYFPTSDGLRLHAWFVPAPSAKGTIIFLHGHSGTPANDLFQVPPFHARGYNVFLIEFRAHGQSEGHWTSMGYLERRDLEAAIAYLEKRGIHRVGLLGFSMGGAVAMSASGGLPQVAAVVANCGFAELWRAAANGARDWGLPRWLAGPVGRVMVALASLRLGLPLWAADPIRHVAAISPRPLLIIVGGCDVYVPPAEGERLYAAAREPKELWIVPEAEHCGVAQVRPEQYYARVLGFFDRNVT